MRVSNLPNSRNFHNSQKFPWTMYYVSKLGGNPLPENMQTVGGCLKILTLSPLDVPMFKDNHHI